MSRYKPGDKVQPTNRARRSFQWVLLNYEHGGFWKTRSADETQMFTYGRHHESEFELVKPPEPDLQPG